MPGQSDLPLRLSAWYLNHLEQLRRWWVRALLVGTGLVLVAAIAVGLLAWRGGRAAAEALRTRVSTPLLSALARADLPAPLTLGSARAVATQPSRVDAIVEVANPNAAYAVRRLRYRFTVGDRALPERTTFLLPGSRRFLFESNVPASTASPTVRVELLAVAFARPTDPQQLERVRFTVPSATLDLAATAGQPPKPAPRLTTTVVNGGLLGFRTVELSVALIAGGLPVAAAQRTVTDWRRDEVRTLEVQWLQAVPPSAEAAVVAQTDLLDDGNLLR